MSLWFTSDPHYSHLNIIKYCERPYKSIEEMDEALIANYNALVMPGDKVFLLGDVMMGPNLKERMTALRQRLNGNITVILGNHDRSRKFMLDCGFDEVLKEIDTTIDGKRVFMRHHPPERPVANPYDIILTGHVHEKWAQKGKLINVGVDVRNYRPISWESLVALLPKME